LAIADGIEEFIDRTAVDGKIALAGTQANAGDRGFAATGTPAEFAGLKFDSGGLLTALHAGIGSRGRGGNRRGDSLYQIRIN
jgi:hypothetical protein